MKEAMSMRSSRHLLRRAGREFVRNLIWMAVAFGALAAILVATTDLPLVGAMAFVGAAAAVMSAIVTGVVIGSNAHAHDETPIGGHHYPGGRPALVAIGPMVGVGMVAEARTAVGEGRAALALLVTFIHRSAWKEYSQKFAGTEV